MEHSIEVRNHIAKADRAMREARKALSLGAVDAAISRAAVAAIQAAQAAILMMRQPADPEDMVDCIQHMAEDGRIETIVAESLRKLVDLRNRADFGPRVFSKSSAQQAVAMADTFCRVTIETARLHYSRHSPEFIVAASRHVEQGGTIPDGVFVPGLTS